MSGQLCLNKEQQKQILKILKEAGVDTSPYETIIDDAGKPNCYHRDVSIHVCDYEDESEEFNMYVQVD